MPDPKIAALTERINARARPSNERPVWWPYPAPLPVRYVSWPCTLPVLPSVPCELAVHVRELADLMPAIVAIKRSLQEDYLDPNGHLWRGVRYRTSPARLIVIADAIEPLWRTHEYIDAMTGWAISVLPESRVVERLAYTSTVWDDEVYVDRPSRPAPRTWVPEVRGELPDFDGWTVTIPGHNRYDLFGQ